jgi:phosphatidylethanolamine/phosphatidyl-N-methylethanolamine N-methyltransferase
MAQRLADYRVFWQQFRRAYNTTGAVLPSGRGLSKALAHYIRHGEHASAGGPTNPRRILEVGPGTGAVTTQIAHDMRPGDELILVERNQEFVNHLQSQLKGAEFDSTRDRIRLIHSGVEELPEDQPVDLIISGLPLNNFSVELVDQLLSKIQRLLAPGGILSFFEYVAIRRAKAVVTSRLDRERLRGIHQILSRLLKQNEIRRDLVLANVPPAWVHHVQLSPKR